MQSMEFVSGKNQKWLRLRRKTPTYKLNLIRYGGLSSIIYLQSLAAYQLRKRALINIPLNQGHKFHIAHI